MKLRIVLFVAALSLCNATWAQVTKESFEKAVDLLNCKTIELSLKGGEGFQQYQQQYPCGEANYTQLKLFLTSVGNLDATIALSREIESLKKAFKENWKKGEVVTFLSETIFTDKTKYQKIFSFADKRKSKPEFNTYRTNLELELFNKLVEDDLQDNVAVTNSDIEQPLKKVERVAVLEKDKAVVNNDKSWFSGITSQIIVVSILISLLFSIITFFIISKFFGDNGDKVSNSIKSYVKRKIEETGFNRSLLDNQSISLELKDINNRIRDLESQIKNLNDKLNSATHNSNITANTIQQSLQEVIQPEITETFFLSAPNSDGSFNESSASSSYRESATIYRFTKIGSNKAKFQIDERDASVRLALQYPDINIAPVCDSENAFNPKAARIITVGLGEAELVGDKWIKNIKAKIRYEN